MLAKAYQNYRKAPVGKDFKTTNDGVMVADVGFKKQLWALDPELDVVWDWGGQKWEIWKFPGQAKRKAKRLDHKAHHVATVQTRNRSFRELGADILLKLQKFRAERWTLQELCDYFDKMEENIERARERRFADFMDALDKDFADYRGIFKSQVPFQYKIKPSEERLLINTGNVKTRRGRAYQLKLPTSTRVRLAITGGC